MKQDEYRTGSMWQSPKDGLWYAEISYLGKRYKTHGSKFKETAERWLERKRLYIQSLIEDKKRRLAEIKEEAKNNPPPIRETMHHKSDYRGSITSYQTTRKGKVIVRHQGEVQCLGRRVRHTSTHRERVEAWVNNVVTNINGIRDNYHKLINDNYKEYVRKDRQLRASEYSEVDKYLETLGVKVENYFQKQDGIRLKKYSGVFTYLLLDNSTSLYKIGKTKNLKQRLASFTNPSYHFEFIHLGDIEKKLHKEFDHRRLHGEWFELTQGDIETIKDTYIFYSLDNQ